MYPASRDSFDLPWKKSKIGRTSACRVTVMYYFVLFLLQPTREQWRKVFFVTCALYVFGAVFYAVFGSANTQDWNNTAQHPVRNSDQSLKDPSSVLSESFEKA